MQGTECQFTAVVQCEWVRLFVLGRLQFHSQFNVYFHYPLSDGLWCAGFGRCLCIGQGQLCCSLCCGSATPELQIPVWEGGIRPHLLQTKQPALVCPQGWFPYAWKGSTSLLPCSCSASQSSKSARLQCLGYTQVSSMSLRSVVCIY